LTGFVADCIQAIGEPEPRLAIKDVLERALSTLGPERALPATRAELVPLHVSDDLTILNVVWAPGMSFRPHNHLMWAAIGLYGGQEDNTFYRRTGHGLIESGGRQLTTGDVALLGDDTIHAVANPRATSIGVLHVYGGNITSRPRRCELDQQAGAEIHYHFDRTRRYFEECNAALSDRRQRRQTQRRTPCTAQPLRPRRPAVRILPVPGRLRGSGRCLAARRSVREVAVSRGRQIRAARRRRRRMGRVEHDLTAEQWIALQMACGGCAYCGVTDVVVQRDCVLALPWRPIHARQRGAGLPFVQCQQVQRRSHWMAAPTAT